MASSPVTVFVTLRPNRDKVSRVEEVQAALTESIRQNELDTLSYHYYKVDAPKEEEKGLVNFIVVMK
jgi:quinol monooxygenase YgiN